MATKKVAKKTVKLPKNFGELKQDKSNEEVFEETVLAVANSKLLSEALLKDYFKKQDKFKTNKFAKEYKEELKDKAIKDHLEVVVSPRLDYCGTCKKEHGYYCPVEDTLDSAEQVKGWNKYSTASTYDTLAIWFVVFLAGTCFGVLLANL